VETHIHEYPYYTTSNQKNLLQQLIKRLQLIDNISNIFLNSQNKVIWDIW